MDKWDLVDRYMEEAAIGVMQDASEREMKALEAFADEKDLSFCTPKAGMEKEWAKAYARFRATMRILDMVAAKGE